MNDFCTTETDAEDDADCGCEAASLLGHDCPEGCGGGASCPYVQQEVEDVRKALAGQRRPEVVTALGLAVVMGRGPLWQADRILAEAQALAVRSERWRLYRGKGHPVGAAVVPHTGCLYIPLLSEAPRGRWLEPPARDDSEEALPF